MANVNAIYNSETGEVDYVPFTDDETAYWQTHQAHLLDVARVEALSAIQTALAATDVWIHRAVEEGIPLPAPRKAYREQLRELLLQAQATDDPAAIVIPAAPPWVPATTT